MRLSQILFSNLKKKVDVKFWMLQYRVFKNDGSKICGMVGDAKI